MRLSELLDYKKITIQCHDNPDADAISSGYALYTYYKSHGIDVSLIYSGKNQIQKANLIYMVDLLDIPISYVEPTNKKIEGLLLTVDCQYGNSNVQKLEADDIAIIDHHNHQCELEKNVHIISEFGSCATVVWKMLLKEEFDFKDNIKLQTALYYGLYTDTSQFISIKNPVDKDMRDALNIDNNIIKKLQNSNISAEELEIAGVAIIRTVINEQLRFAIVRAQKCDPNILGLISDLVLQVNEIDKCIVYCEMNDGIKFSVRSCVKEHRANDIAQFVSKEIGSGGGHNDKAGGFISLDSYKKKYENYDYTTFFTHKLKNYALYYEVIDSETYDYDLSTAKKYVKKALKVGYIKVSDFIDEGTVVLIRTLEGDLHIEINKDMYLMLGVKGEVYPISKAQFEKTYVTADDEVYDMKLTYHPKAIIRKHDQEYSLLDYVHVCYGTGGNEIFARQLDHAVKVFTKWDRNSYTIGETGDYLATKEHEKNDVYIIEKETFELTYEEV